MSKTTAPVSTPSPTREQSQSSAAVGSSKNPHTEFFVAALNMSWQLAIVVLVPIVAGFKLDEKLNTAPALTIIGFVLAMAGMAVVVWRQLQLFGPSNAPNGKHL